MDNQQLIQRFYDENVEQNCPIAIQNKKRLVEGFLRYSTKEAQTVTAEDIEQYLTCLYREGKRKRYIRRVNYALNAFYRYLDSLDLKTEQPTKNVRTPWTIHPPEPRKPWILSEHELIPSNQVIVNDYLKAMVAQNYSMETLDIYRQTLRRFFLAVPKPVGELTKEDIWQWLIDHYGEKKKSTLHNVLAILSGFSAYCLEEGHIKTHLIKKVWWPNIPRSIPKFIEARDVEKVRIIAESASLRDRTIFEFLSSTGCRRGEVIRLNIENLNMKDRTVWVLGKGQKKRQVIFSDECLLLLERYIETHPIGTGALFLNKDHQRLGGSWVRTMVSRLGNKACLTNLYPHRFRHTFATRMLSKGVPLQTIGDFLGHEDMNTTRIYANIPLPELKETYKRSMG